MRQGGKGGGGRGVGAEALNSVLKPLLLDEKCLRSAYEP